MRFANHTLILAGFAAGLGCARPDLRFTSAQLAPCDAATPIADALGPPAATIHFVTRTGARLTLDAAPFRFAGADIYWLGLDENVGGVAAPSRFRVDDALDTAVLMGASVVRSISLGVSVGCSVCLEPTAGTFNDAAFDPIDYAISAARQRGLRVVIPLTDNYRYFSGGRFVFTDWRGLTSPSCDLICPQGDAFFTDPRVTQDYEDYIRHLLEHVNPYTGLAYANDPTILAWETGNEVDGHPAGYTPQILSWTRTIAGFIKSLAPQQLVVDGYIHSDRTADALAIDGVDLYTGHYYPMDADAMRGDAARVAAAGRAFFVGEFDWINLDGGDRLDTFLDAALADTDVAGDLYWSLFPHLDTFGFEQHADGYTLHYPGDDVDRQVRVQKLAEHAFAIRAAAGPIDVTPAQPLITSITSSAAGYAIAWRGVAAAASYSVETSTDGPDGPWLLVCDRCATDNDAPWLHEAQDPRWYRVSANSPCGAAGPYSAAQGTSP